MICCCPLSSVLAVSRSLLSSVLCPLSSVLVVSRSLLSSVLCPLSSVLAVSRSLLSSVLCPLSSVLVLFFLFACATDPVTTDLAAYLNQGVMNLAELEQKALGRYNAVTGSNYTSDETVYNALKDHVIPLYRRFLDGLRALRPDTIEVNDLNRLYVQAAQSMYDGFKLKMVGIEKHETNIIIAGNRKIDEGRIQTEKWRSELSALAKKHDLALLGGEQKSSWLDIFRPASGTE
jgi:hypothetical protein